MQPKIYIPGSGAVPAATTGDVERVVRGLSPDQLAQNFINLLDGFNKLVGEAANQAEENALFAAGYRLVVRTDLIAGYVPPNILPTSTIIMAVAVNQSPTSTVVFSGITA